MVWQKKTKRVRWRFNHLLIISIFFVSSLLTGQTYKSNDSLQINSLLDSCWIHRTSNPLLALEYGNNALKLIVKKRITSLKPKTLNYLGVVYRKLGNLDKSYIYFAEALNLATALNDSVQIGYTYNNFADYYLKKASFSIALENVLIGYQIFNRLNHKVGMAYSLNYLGEIYIHQGDYQKALTYLDEALKLREDTNDLRGYVNTATNIGKIYFELKNFDKAIVYYSKSSALSQDIKYHKGKSRILSLMGDIFYEKNEFAQALKNIREAYLIDQKIMNKSGQIINLNKIGLNNLKLKNYKIAEESFKTALELANESGHLDQEMLSYLYLSRYYSSKNLNKKAFESLSRYISIRDSIYSNENMGRFADLQTLFATNKKEIENEIEKRVLLKEIEFSTRTSQYLFVISIVTIIIILLLVSKFRTQKKTNKLLNELNSSKDKFFAILAHDLKNPFQGLLGYTEMLHSDYELYTENEIRMSIASLHRVTRSVYYLLEGLLEWSRAQTGRMDYNPTLFKLSEEAIKVLDLLKENAEVKVISLSMEFDDTLVTYADRNMVSTILRNLVTNAIKFSEKDNIVKILATKNTDGIVVTVCDNGIGMSQEELDSLFRIDVHHTTLGTDGEEGTGVGLILCKELVQNNGGKIWAESELGKGSKFIFTLPSSKK